MTKMSADKTKSSSQAALSATQFRNAKQLPLGNGFVLVQVANGQYGRVVPAADNAQALVAKAAAALKRPGIDKSSVFRGAKPDKVFAYSVLPSDTTKVVRESSDGSKRIGRLGVNGRFKALKAV